MTLHKPTWMTADQPSHQDEDERELEAFLRTQDPVAFEAALWLTRQDAGLSADDQHRFEQWLAADGAHAQAYADLSPSLDAVRALPDAAQARLQAGLPSRISPNKPVLHHPSLPVGPTVLPSMPGRRAWMLNVARFVPAAAAAGMAAAVVGGHWVGWDAQAGWLIHTRRYTTKRGELRDVQLDDGSTLALDADTSVWVALYQGRREVRVQQGQVMFTVEPDAARPFHVMAGALRITVVGTRFSVRHTETGLDARRTVVAVESGRVRVGPKQPGPANASVVLGAGDSISADAQGRLDAIIQVGAQNVAVWRQGRVSFSDTPMSQALAEFERYGDTGLTLRDPAVGALRLGGTFDLHAAQTFAQALPHLLPVRLQRTPYGTEIVSSR